MSFSVSAAVTTVAVNTYMRFTISGLTITSVAGACNGLFSGFDQSLTVRILGSSIELISPSINSNGTFNAYGTCQFTV